MKVVQESQTTRLNLVLLRAASKSFQEGDCVVYSGQAGPYIWLRNERGVMEGLHRMSFRNYYKRKPTKVVRHSCDNPRCWNPVHLLDGTDADNIQDKMDRNRDFACIGEDHYLSKLTDVQTSEIQALLKEGVTQKVLASRYSVSQTLISAIKLGKVRKRRMEIVQ